MNKFLQITAANIVFALFCEGLLTVCDKLQNPMSMDETSFSERVYGKLSQLPLLILYAYGSVYQILSYTTIVVRCLQD